MRSVAPASSSLLVAARAAVVVAALGSIVALRAAEQAAPRAGDGTLYFGAYSGHILGVSEASGDVVAKIPLQTGFPNAVQMSHDGTRLYALSANRQRFEIVDIAAGKSIDTFSLNQQTTRLLVQGFAVDPAHSFLYVAGRPTTKRRDRFDIATATLYKYDMRTHALVATSAWPDEFEAPFMTAMRVSPDGKLLYVFADTVLVHRTGDLGRAGEFDLAQPVEPGFGSMDLGSFDDVLDEPGFLTGLFTTEDPVQHRRQLGVGRFDLTKQAVDFFTLGPVPDARSLDFALAPGRKRGYMLVQQIGHYEFWTIDLEARRVTSRIEFDGRPRMSLRVSTSGEVVYIYGAGPTIDLYDPDGFKPLRTITLDTDVPYETFHVLPNRRAGRLD